jgi:hypothetical protein
MKKFVHLHIPKTAGVSFYWTLKDLITDISGDLRHNVIKAGDPRSVFYGHVPTWQLVRDRNISQGYIDEAVVFFTLRNAWERFVSLFYYLNLENKGKRGELFRKWTIMEYAEDVLGADKNKHNLGHPHSYWLRGIDHAIAIPFGPGMQKGFNKVCRIIGIEPRPLQHRNANENYHMTHAEVYQRNPGLREIVAAIYVEDIHRFGQTFPY